MKTVPSSVDGSDIYQHALCDESPDAPGQVRGQTVGCRAGDLQADSDLLPPSHESSSLAVTLLTLSEMTAGFQQAGVICHKTNCYKSARQTRNSSPTMF